MSHTRCGLKNTNQYPNHPSALLQSLKDSSKDSACSATEIQKNNELMGVKLFLLVQYNPSFFLHCISCFFPAGWFDKQCLMQRLRRGREGMKKQSQTTQTRMEQEERTSSHLLNKNKSEGSYFIKSFL